MVGFEEMRDELLERIEDLLKRKQYTALRDLLADLEPADIASLFEDLDEDSIPLLFRLLPKEPAAEVFVELDPDAQEMLIRGFRTPSSKRSLTSCIWTMRSTSWRKCPRTSSSAS